MIKFDASKVSFEIVQLKTVTTSLGGSITIVDKVNSTEEKEAYKRIVVPMAVARGFIQSTHKITKYLKPVYTALVRYDDHIMAMERHPLAGLGELETDGLFGKKTWEPAAQQAFAVVRDQLIASGHDWFFDGRYVYSFDGATVKRAIEEASNLTKDGQFRKVVTTTFDMQTLPSGKVPADQRSCMAFVASTDEMAVSPPIWKNLNDIGSSKLDNRTTDSDYLDEDDDSVEIVVNNNYTFDTINNAFQVNLNFALKAGNEIGRIFGYEFVEPLHLSRLMIELHTTNLPNVPKEIKSTYGIGIPFTHVIAWLLGMSRKANTLETYITMRSLMKYLTKKGIFKADQFNAANVFKAGQTVADVPVIGLTELMKIHNSSTFSFATVLDKVNTTSKAKRMNNDIHAIGTLLNEE